MGVGLGCRVELQRGKDTFGTQFQDQAGLPATCIYACHPVVIIWAILLQTFYLLQVVK